MTSAFNVGDRVTSRFLVGEWEIVGFRMDGTARVTDANDNITLAIPVGILEVSS